MDVLLQTYKEEKEAFVSQLQGTSVYRVNVVSLTALTTYGLWASLRNRGLTFAIDDGRSTRRRRSKQTIRSSAFTFELIQGFGFEFLLLVVPLLLACTILSESVVLLNVVLTLASCFILSLYPARPAHPSAMIDQKRKTSREKHHWSKLSDDEEEEDEEKERNNIEASQRAAQNNSGATGVEDVKHPFRVSVDSAAETAHSSASPTTDFVAPGTPSKDASTKVLRTPKSTRLSHRSSPSLARSAAPLPEQDSKFAEERSDLNPYVPRNQPFLSVYRAHMMLMTMICILAVDFKAFPREFAKCETWGTSLMDLGVGSFVFSLGIISALPMLRLPSQRFKPLRLQLLRDARRSVPIFLLGILRVAMVKGVEYPEHISEYGVHWNFFFTLALLPFFATFGRPVARRVRFATLGLVLSLVHQCFLTFTSLGEWASSNNVQRTTIISQNKEGLVSLPGYLAVFLIGLDLGHYVLPRDPYLAYRRPTASRRREKTDKLAMLLLSFAFLWWSAFYMQNVLLAHQVSRRLANLPYVLWVAAYNTAFLLAYVTIYMALLQPLDGRTLYRGSSTGKKSSAPDESDLHSDTSSADTAKIPALLDALNTHSFAVFLVANLLAGLVNVVVRTMYASDTVAIAILLAYLAACFAYCLAAQAFGIRLRM